ncbi:hypothetical protein BS47DRAFT_1353565, partial [Hydnum rufescens UP504]
MHASTQIHEIHGNESAVRTNPSPISSSFAKPRHWDTRTVCRAQRKGHSARDAPRPLRERDTLAVRSLRSLSLSLSLSAFAALPD